MDFPAESPPRPVRMSIFSSALSRPIWVCLKIVYPYTQWLMITIFRHTHLMHIFCLGEWSIGFDDLAVRGSMGKIRF